MSIEDTDPVSGPAHGVLPDAIIADATSEASLIFVRLDPALDRARVITWLKAATALVGTLEAPVDGTPQASAAVAFGPSFFLSGATARFGLDGRIPHEFSDLPVVPAAGATVAADILFYVLSRSRALVMDFIVSLWGTRDGGLLSIEIEHGFQRSSGRELFGARDGLRNIPSAERPQVVFVGTDAADEPDWTDAGTYVAYMKLPQNMDAWAKLDDTEKQRRVGRRLDGSRLDLDPGSDPHADGDYGSNDTPAPAAHVRKAGPRGANLTSRIFRRGVPFVDVADGKVSAGLQFVSFQRSLDDFETILNRWMLAKDFQSPGAGVDLLFTDDLVTIEKVGFFFAPASDSRFMGAAMFDAPRPRRGDGRVFVRKKLVDASGAKIPGQLDGAVFQIVRADTNALIGGTFVTDSGGHGVSPEVPVGVPLLVREISPLSGAQVAPDAPIQLEGPHGSVEIRNVIPTPNPIPSPYHA
jgi:Dyp-type peroxidase family